MASENVNTLDLTTPTKRRAGSWRAAARRSRAAQLYALRRDRLFAGSAALFINMVDAGRLRIRVRHDRGSHVHSTSYRYGVCVGCIAAAQMLGMVSRARDRLLLRALPSGHSRIAQGPNDARDRTVCRWWPHRRADRTPPCGPTAWPCCSSTLRSPRSCRGVDLLERARRRDGALSSESGASRPRLAACASPHSCSLVSIGALGAGHAAATSISVRHGGPLGRPLRRALSFALVLAWRALSADAAGAPRAAPAL